MKSIKKIIPFIVVSAIFIFLIWNVSKQWETLSSIQWKFRPGNFILFLLFLLPIYALDAFSWHLVTRALGAHITYMKNFQIWVFSNAGRFLPGSIWQYAGRVYLAGQAGMSKTQAITAVVAEALFALLLGALVILLTLTFWKLPIGGVEEGLIKFIAALGTLLLVVVIALLSNKSAAVYMVKLLGRVTKKGEVLNSINIPFFYLPKVAGSFFLQFVCGGLVLFFLSRSVVDLTLDLMPVFVGIYAASWLLGYISIFAPSGLGVQEIILATLLSSYMPFPLAVALAILFRISFLSSETLALVFNLIRKRMT